MLFGSDPVGWMHEYDDSSDDGWASFDDTATGASLEDNMRSFEEPSPDAAHDPAPESEGDASN